MAKKTNNRFAPGELSTIIGQDAELEGNLKVQASMRIDGRVKGELNCKDTVTVGSEGSIEGNVSAKDIVIGGKITGQLNATGKIILESSSVLNGDLKTVRLVIEEGAVFNGSSEMSGGGSPPQKHPPRQIKLDEEE